MQIIIRAAFKTGQEEALGPLGQNLTTLHKPPVLIPNLIPQGRRKENIKWSGQEVGVVEVWLS